MFKSLLVLRIKMDLTPFHLSSSKDTSKYLIEECHIDPKTIDGNNITLLHKSTSDIKYLVEKLKIKPNDKNINGYTPLHIAVREEKLSVVKNLIENYSVNVNIKDKNKNTSSQVASEKPPSQSQMKKESDWSWRRIGGKPMIWAESWARSRSVTVLLVFDAWLLRTVGKMTAFILLLRIRAIRCFRRHGICLWLTKWAELWRTTV
jgi:hypothetical protein